MTTTPVMTITDEQIAEIERDIAAQEAIKHGQCEGGVIVRGEICRECGATPKDSCRRPLPKSYAVPANITALISRLRAAEKDAERLNKLDAIGYAYGFEDMHEGNRWMIDGPYRDIRTAIDDMPDAAMEESE